MKHNILFTCAGRRNYLINYFKEALKGNGKVIAADNDLTAPALIDADIAELVPDIYHKSYINSLKKIIKIHNVTAVISLYDLELPIMSKHKKELEHEGVQVIISSEEVISIAFDKWRTFNFINSIGLKSPKTYLNLDSALQALENGDLNFPLVLKPRWGSNSIAIDFPESIEELKLAYSLQKLKIKKSILSRASSEDIDQAILIQEKLIGKEYGLDVINDLNSNYFGTFIREKLSMRCGETDKAKSVIDNSIEAIGAKLGTRLKHVGLMDCDAFLVKNELYILELNPRFGGGYPFSHEAGVNVAAIYLEWLSGNSNKNVNMYVNYKENIIFSKCDRLLGISK